MQELFFQLIGWLKVELGVSPVGMVLFHGLIYLCMVHVHGLSCRLRATFGKITQKQFKKKLCKCSKIRLLSLVNVTMVCNRSIEPYR